MNEKFEYISNEVKEELNNLDPMAFVNLLIKISTEPTLADCVAAADYCEKMVNIFKKMAYALGYQQGLTEGPESD